MEVIIKDTYEAMGKKAAEDLLSIINTLPVPLLCPTAGNTPAALYKELVRKIKAENIDCSRWLFAGLDEWAGMNGNDEGSCRHFVNEHLFQPLNIKEENICFFDGRAADLQSECTRMENFIQQHGGIDVALVGLGLNGHIGMNEPGTAATLRSHIAVIDEQTQTIGQKYFSEPHDLSHGLTLGLATLMEAKHIFLLANGSKKAAIVKKMMEEDESNLVPATLLRRHPGFKVYVDSAAAELIG